MRIHHNLKFGKQPDISRVTEIAKNSAWKFCRRPPPERSGFLSDQDIMAHDKEIIRLGQIEVRFLLESKDTHGQLATFEFTVPAGAKVPVPHSHEHYDETIYGLEGVLTFTVNGQPVDIAAGDTCFIPRGAMHGFNNLKPTNAKALAVVTPALIGPEFFREMAAIINVAGPPDVEKLKAVMNKHGLVPAPLQK